VTPPRPAGPSVTDDATADAGNLVEPRWTTHSGLLRIRSTNDAGHWTLELDGELDLSSVATLDSEIRLAEACAKTVTIDLRGLSFMDSSGLNAILDAQHRSRLNGRLRLRRGTASVQTVCRLTGAEETLPFDR
jgi:stage II sporulation protein AA (anti-sigma F factor antagonist)